MKVQNREIFRDKEQIGGYLGLEGGWQERVITKG